MQRQAAGTHLAVELIVVGDEEVAVGVIDSVSGEHASVSLAHNALHVVAGRGAQQRDIKVEVGWLLLAAIIHCAGRCEPHEHLQQICTGKVANLSEAFSEGNSLMNVGGSACG